MSTKKFLVCGLGKVGCAVADTLDKMYFDVVAVDIDEKVIADIRQRSDCRFMCYVADAKDPAFVEGLRDVTDFNVAVVVIGDFLTRMLCTKIIKNYARQTNREIEVIAWAANMMEESMLKDLGARRFIRVEENLGKYLAYTASSNDLLDFNSLRLEETVGVDKVDVDTLQDAYAVMTLSIPNNFKGKTINDFAVEYMESGQKIIALHTRGVGSKEPVFCDNPNFNSESLRAGDSIIICGYHEKLRKLIRNIAEQSRNA